MGKREDLIQSCELSCDLTHEGKDMIRSEFLSECKVSPFGLLESVTKIGSVPLTEPEEYTTKME